MLCTPASLHPFLRSRAWFSASAAHENPLESIFKTLVPDQVWTADWQQQRYLGACRKCKFSGAMRTCWVRLSKDGAQGSVFQQTSDNSRAPSPGQLNGPLRNGTLGICIFLQHCESGESPLLRDNVRPRGNWESSIL